MITRSSARSVNETMASAPGASSATPPNAGRIEDAKHDISHGLRRHLAAVEGVDDGSGAALHFVADAHRAAVDQHQHHGLLEREHRLQQRLLRRRQASENSSTEHEAHPSNFHELRRVSFK